MEEIGQAAVTDSLFLLLIVTIISTFLFAFTSTYGANVSDHLIRQYSVDYTTDALKSILYSSTPRNAQDVIGFEDQIPKEVDYLLTLIKEDYADTKSFSDESKTILRKTIERIMSPVSGQFDYMFFIQREDTQQFIYVLLYKSEFLCDGGECVLGKRNVRVTPSNPAHKFYYCNNYTNEKEMLTQTLQNFFFDIGQNYQSSAPILLIISRDIKDPNVALIDIETAPAKAFLIMWPATLITKEKMELAGCKEV